jgi:competence protein ComGC
MKKTKNKDTKQKYKNFKKLSLLVLLITLVLVAILFFVNRGPKLTAEQKTTKKVADNLINSLVRCDYKQYLEVIDKTPQEIQEIRSAQDNKEDTFDLFSEFNYYLPEDKFKVYCEKYESRKYISGYVKDSFIPNSKPIYQFFYSIGTSGKWEAVEVFVTDEEGKWTSDVPSGT